MHLFCFDAVTAALYQKIDHTPLRLTQVALWSCSTKSSSCLTIHHLGSLVQWWAVVPWKEISFQVLSKILKGQQHFSTTSWQYWWTHSARSGNSDRRYFLSPAFGWNEYQIFNPTQCVYTTQHDAYCPASWHRERTKGDVPSASLVEQLKGNYEQGVRGTQDRLKGQKLLEGDQPVWRRKRIWWQSLHHQMSSF